MCYDTYEESPKLFFFILEAENKEYRELNLIIQNKMAAISH